MKYTIFLYTLLTLFCSVLSAAELTDLNNEQLLAMQHNDGALVIDVRTAQEWQSTGIIPNSHKLEFFNKDGKYNAEQWLNALNKLKSRPDQPVILVCRSGNRSGMVGNFLTKQKGMPNVYHLSSGIQSWIKAGNETDADCPNQVACK
jgi:rhodanese-related sulfurtransferase